MFTRRSVVGLFGGLLAWLTDKARAKEPAVRDTLVMGNFRPYMPDWCPQGFIPLMGDEISKEHFPQLFLPEKKPNGRTYYPPFFGGTDTVRLPKYVPYVPDALVANGFMGNLTQIKHKKPDTRITVRLMAATKQRSSNGRVLYPGFCMDMPLEREVFENSYGKIDDSKQSRFWYDGLETVQLYGTKEI